MTDSSRRLARTWPYKHQQDYDREMRAIATRWFASHGHAVHPRYSFILDNWDNWSRNIIVVEVADYIKNTRTQREANKVGFPLHKYVHHGLSSQAMLFNLIGPLIVRNDPAPLEMALGATGIPWPQGDITLEFEIEDREVFNEDTGQPTSIDLVVKGENGMSLYVESKLVEKEFGGCSVFAGGDCDGQNPALQHEMCYLHHIGRKYWEQLKEHGFLQGALKDSPVCLLATYYQFFREVLFAIHNNGYFVLLNDDRNPAFYCESTDGQTRGLWPFLLQFVPAQHQHRLKRITIQQVVAAVEASGRHADWIGEFKRKYGLS